MLLLLLPLICASVLAADPLPDCASVVTPLDPSPVRSPQAVHTALLPHIAGKTLVEIGTRNGDGMACFSRVAASAVAIELDEKYCEKLRGRSRAQTTTTSSGGGGTAAPTGNFSVLCQDYRNACIRDADIVTWWQQLPHLSNMAGLAHLARMQRRGLLKPSAEAALLFDNKWRTDMTSFKQLKEYSRVRQRIAFDESRICEGMLDKADPDRRYCAKRSWGNFTLALFPIVRVADLALAEERALGAQSLNVQCGAKAAAKAAVKAAATMTTVAATPPSSSGDGTIACTPGFASEDYCNNRCTEPASAVASLPQPSAAAASRPCKLLSSQRVISRDEWRGHWVQHHEGDQEGAAAPEPLWEFASGCSLANPTRSSAAECLRGQRLVFIGDCVMRYQYLSLVHFLETGSWGPRIVDPQTLEQQGVTSLPESISIGYSLARDETSGKTDYASFYTKSSAMLNGKEKCDCGIHDKDLGLPPRKFKWIENRYENRYYRNDALDVSVSFFFVKGKFAVHGHGSGDGGNAWKHSHFPTFVQQQVAPLKPTAVVLNIGLWWFTADYASRALNATWWSEALLAVKKTVVGSSSSSSSKGGGGGGGGGTVILRTTTTTVPWRSHDNDGVDGQLIQSNAVDRVVRGIVRQQRRGHESGGSDGSVEPTFAVLDTYEMTSALPNAHCKVRLDPSGGAPPAKDALPLKFYADDMHFQPFVYKEFNRALLGMICAGGGGDGNGNGGHHDHKRRKGM